MLRKLKRHAGIAALAVAVMALFVALSGIAGAIPGKNTVNSGDVKDDSLKGTDIKESTLTLPPTQTSPNVVQRTATLGPIPTAQSGDAVASCVGAEKAVGGGFAVQSTDRGRIDGSRPELNAQGVPTGWHVFVGNNTGGTVQYQVYVLCAS
jgi:hypothetical protein